MVDNTKWKLHILDAPGSEEYGVTQDQCITDSQAFIIVYSISNKESFNEAIIWREKILRSKEYKEPPMYVNNGI